MRKSVKGRLETDGMQLKAGFFTGDSVGVTSGKAFIQNTEISALWGAVSLAVLGEGQVRGSLLLGREGAGVSAHSLTLEKDTVIRSLLGPAWAAAKGTLTVQETSLRSPETAYLRALEIDAKGLQMDGNRTSIDGQEKATIRRSHFQATHSHTLNTKGNVIYSENTSRAPLTQIHGDRVVAENNQGTGDLVLLAQNQVILDGLTLEGRADAFGREVDLKGDLRSTWLKATAQRIVNDSDLRVTKDFLLRGDHVEQRNRLSAGGHGRIDAYESYTDRPHTLTHAEEKMILNAPKTKFVKGKLKAPTFEAHMDVRDTPEFLDLLQKIESDRVVLSLPKADLSFTQKTSIKPDLFLEAYRLQNEATLETQGYFIARLATTFLNRNQVTIQGQGGIEAPQGITNLGAMTGNQGLQLNTSGLLTHKGVLSGGKGQLVLYAQKIDAAAQGLHQYSLLRGDSIYAEAETDFLADGLKVRAREATLKAGDLLRLGAWVETFRSEERERSFFGLNEKITRRTWQEACVFEGACTEKLQLFSLRGHVRGEGASLQSPFLKIHGEKGTSLRDLRLVRTEKVEKRSFCLEVLGVNIFNPFEEGLPMPKLSVEAGEQMRQTQTTHTYGLHGHLMAHQFELSTGKGEGANLQGSHLQVHHMISSTPLLKLGGAPYESLCEENKFKGMVGVAYKGGIVPTASVSRSWEENRIQGSRRSQVSIGHFENRWDNAEIRVAHGIEGGIHKASGAQFKAHIDHSQTIVSQKGRSSGVSLTGPDFSVSGGAKWGAKYTSEGTSFGIDDAPNLTQRTDQRYEDKDTRGGVSLTFGKSLGSEKFLDQIGGSFQYGGQSFTADSRFFEAWNTPFSCEGTAFDHMLSDTRGYVDQGKAVMAGVSNLVSLGSLAGLPLETVQPILKHGNQGIQVMELGLGVVEQERLIEKAWPKVPEASWPRKDDLGIDLESEGMSASLAGETQVVERGALQINDSHQSPPTSAEGSQKVQEVLTFHPTTRGENRGLASVPNLAVKPEIARRSPTPSEGVLSLPQDSSISSPRSDGDLNLSTATSVAGDVASGLSSTAAVSANPTVSTVGKGVAWILGHVSEEAERSQQRDSNSAAQDAIDSLGGTSALKSAVITSSVACGPTLVGGPAVYGSCVLGATATLGTASAVLGVDVPTLGRDIVVVLGVDMAKTIRDGIRDAPAFLENGVRETLMKRF